MVERATRCYAPTVRAAVLALSALGLGGAKPVLADVLPPGCLSDPDGLQMFGAAAYNSVRDEYVLLYPAGLEARVARLDPCGQMLGEHSVLSTTNPLNLVALAYNEEHNEYLAALRHDQPSVVDLLYLDAEARPIGAPFELAQPSSDIRLVANSAHDHYLAVWQHPGDWQNPATNPQTLRYRLVSGDSSSPTLLGAETMFASAAISPAVAFNSRADKYLVVFTGDINLLVPNNDTIYGRFIRGDGTLVDGTLPLAMWFESQRTPEVAYSDVSNQWLVAFSDWGQARMGHSGDLSAVLVEENGTVARTLELARTAMDRWETLGPIGFLPGRDRFIVTYFEAVTAYGREVDPASGTLFDPFVFSDDNANPRALAIRPVSSGPQYLLDWSRTNNGVCASIATLEGTCDAPVAPRETSDDSQRDASTELQVPQDGNAEAGRSDAGVQSGCGCRVAPRPQVGIHWLGAAALLLVARRMGWLT